MQATSKGSDQTARMRRLILGFAGWTYHIVVNLMPQLIWKLLVTSLSTWVHNGCIVEGYIDNVPENQFSCMISKIFIVISVFIYQKMC